MSNKLKHKPLLWPASVEQIWAYVKSWPSEIYQLWLKHCSGKLTGNEKARRRYPDYWNNVGEFDPFFHRRNVMGNILRALGFAIFGKKSPKCVPDTMWGDINKAIEK